MTRAELAELKKTIRSGVTFPLVVAGIIAIGGSVWRNEAVDSKQAAEIQSHTKAIDSMPSRDMVIALKEQVNRIEVSIDGIRSEMARLKGR